MQYTLIILVLITFIVPNVYSRTWTDKQGREMEAEFISATKYKVKVKRTDGQIFEILINTLSTKDQIFAESQWRNTPEKPNIETFRRENNSHDNFKTIEPLIESKQLGIGKSPNRLTIPSLSSDELGKDYPTPTSCIVNFLVWWGHTIAPESMPHRDREKAIRRIAEDLDDYFPGDSYTISDMMDGITKYSEKKLDDFVITAQRHEAPTIEQLEEFTSGWFGVIAFFGMYEEKNGTLRRQYTRCSSLVKADQFSVIHNLYGHQYIMTVIKDTESDTPQQKPNTRYYPSRDMIKFSNGSQEKNGYIPDNMVAQLETIIVFNISELAPPDDENEQ